MRISCIQKYEHKLSAWICALNGGMRSMNGTNDVLIVDSLFLIVRNLQHLSIVELGT